MNDLSDTVQVIWSIAGTFCRPCESSRYCHAGHSLLPLCRDWESVA